jgi:hygromycin-B 7''-O-kinase
MAAENRATVNPEAGVLEMLDELAGYRRFFMDADLWRPFVEQVCARHGLVPCAEVRAGLPGTYPTFSVMDRWVVKYFGRLFDGLESYQVEATLGRALATAPGIPAPALLAAGRLFEEQGGWAWPYLVYAYLPGVSLGEVYDQVTRPDRLAAAAYLGRAIRRLHSLPPVGGSGRLAADWNVYRAFLAGQHRQCRQALAAAKALPDGLLDQVEAYLPPLAQLIEWRAAPHWIHADLTRDHLLGRLEQGRWISHGLIDFGDARTGDLAYELVALHLDLFGCDRELLAAFLAAYGLPEAEQPALLRRAMTMTLLHQFSAGCLQVAFRAVPAARQAETLAQLAGWIWGVTCE